MSKRRLLKRLLSDEITLEQFRECIEMDRVGVLKYFVDKKEWFDSPHDNNSESDSDPN